MVCSTVECLGNKCLTVQWIDIIFPSSMEAQCSEHLSYGWTVFVQLFNRWSVYVQMSEGWTVFIQMYDGWTMIIQMFKCWTVYVQLSNGWTCPWRLAPGVL